MTWKSYVEITSSNKKKVHYTLKIDNFKDTSSDRKKKYTFSLKINNFLPLQANLTK